MLNNKKESLEDFYGKHYEYMLKAEKHALASIILARNFANADKARIVSRIKEPDSMRKKLLKDGFQVNYESIFVKESDAIGIRIIADSVKDVYRIYKEMKKILNSKHDCTILTVKDYIKNPKDSGYRSLHIIVAVDSEDPDFPELKVEVQLRTAVMDCWASLEHLVTYKQQIDPTQEILDMLEMYSEEAEKELRSIE